MAINPSLNYLLQGNDEEQLDEPQSKTRLTLENPSLNYLMNPTEEQKQPTVFNGFRATHTTERNPRRFKKR